MVQQHLRNVLPRDAVAATHLLEESGGGVGIEAGSRHVADADAIGFRFFLAREVDLRLRGRALRCGENAGSGIAPAAQRTDEDGAEHRRHGRQAEATLHLDGARDVSLCHVTDLVRQHARQLDSLLVMRMKPACEKMNPPGSANAFID